MIHTSTGSIVVGVGDFSVVIPFDMKSVPERSAHKSFETVKKITKPLIFPVESISG